MSAATRKPSARGKAAKTEVIVAEAPIKATPAAVDPATDGPIATMLDQLQLDIFRGVLKPGERLDERSLAERFKASRTPVREVLMRMASMGIVELRRNHGAFVKEISPGDIIGMLEVTAELKVLAARQAARRMSAAERAHLASLLPQQEALAASGDAAAYFKAASGLFGVIFDGAHNACLVRTMHGIHLQLAAYRRWLIQVLQRPMQTSLHENLAVAEAVVRGDADAAERAMRLHTEVRREELSDLISLMFEQSSRLGQAPEAADMLEFA